MNAQARAYIVKYIPFTSPNAYHVVNTATKVTHTMYDDILKARAAAKDLNLAVRRGQLVKAKSPLRLVVSR